MWLFLAAITTVPAAHPAALPAMHHLLFLLPLHPLRDTRDHPLWVKWKRSTLNLNTSRNTRRSCQACDACCSAVFFFTLVTGPRRSLSLKLSDTRVYAVLGYDQPPSQNGAMLTVHRDKSNPTLEALHPTHYEEIASLSSYTSILGDT